MRVLIIKTSSLGDIIHTFPIIDFIREHFPDCIIDWVVESTNAELLYNHPNVDNVIEINSKKWRKSLLSTDTWKAIGVAKKSLRKVTYDVVFDLQGNIKSGLVLSQVRSPDKVGFSNKCVAEWPNIFFTNKKFALDRDRNIRDDYLSVVQQYFQIDNSQKSSGIKLQISDNERDLVDSFFDTPQLHARRCILMCPGANWENKRLSEEILKRLVSKIHHTHDDIAILYSWGTDREKLLCTSLLDLEPCKSLLTPKLKLPTLQYLMSRVHCVFAMDSLPLHLAGTTSTPTASLFGPSSAKKYLPIGERHKVIQGPCPYGRHFEKRCPVLRTCPTGACIKNLEVDAIYQTIIQSLDCHK